MLRLPSLRCHQLLWMIVEWVCPPVMGKCELGSLILHNHTLQTEIITHIYMTTWLIKTSIKAGSEKLLMPSDGRICRVKQNQWIKLLYLHISVLKSCNSLGTCDFIISNSKVMVFCKKYASLSLDCMINHDNFAKIVCGKYRKSLYDHRLFDPDQNIPRSIKSGDNQIIWGWNWGCVYQYQYIYHDHQWNSH